MLRGWRIPAELGAIGRYQTPGTQPLIQGTLCIHQGFVKQQQNGSANSIFLPILAYSCLFYLGFSR